MPAPSRRPKTPAGTAGKAQGGLPLGNPVCLWQTELFKLNLKSSPSPSGHNRRRRLATRRCDTKRAGTTAVVPATIEWQQCLLHLHFFDTLRLQGNFLCGLFSFRTQSRHGHMVTVKGARKERMAHSFPCGQTLKEACSCLSILTKMTKQPQYLKLFSFSYFRQHALATFWQPDRKERWRGGRGFFRCPARRCRRYVYRY